MTIPVAAIIFSIIALICIVACVVVYFNLPSIKGLISGIGQAGINTVKDLGQEGIAKVKSLGQEGVTKLKVLGEDIKNASYTRGVGKIPGRAACKSGYKSTVLTCTACPDKGHYNYTWGCGTLIAKCHDGSKGCKNDCYATWISDIQCDTYTRAQTCDAGYELVSGLCYPACKSGYHSVGAVCWKNT